MPNARNAKKKAPLKTPDNQKPQRRTQIMKITSK